MPVDMDEPAAKVEEEEPMTMGISEYEFIYNEFSDLRFVLVDQRRETQEDKLLANEQFEAQQVLLRSILSRFPHAPRASSSALQ